MEEAEVSLEHLHEQAHETAAHSRENWISLVFGAVGCVFLALAVMTR